MMHAMPLAVKYLVHFRLRSAILLACLSAVLFLPLAVNLLVAHYHHQMIERAEATPLVVGAPGSDYDLVLNTLFYKGQIERSLSMRHADAIRESGLAALAPLYIKHTASGRPIVGTTLDYFERRGLKASRGHLPQSLGDIVLGASAARLLDLTVGDNLLSDDEKLYDISSSLPLRMRVVGVLKQSGTADDLVIFADLKTTWVIDGIGHGHADARNAGDPTLIQSVRENNLVLSAAVMQYNEITPDQLDSFHFHGDPRTFPITSLVVWPDDAKSATILAARLRADDETLLVQPRAVAEEMMDIVFLVRRFFDAVFTLVLASTVLLLALVVLLSLRARQREFETLHKLGCGRSTVLVIQACEWTLLVLASATLAAAASGVMMWYVIRFGALAP
jgi:putative ABC transport system permease protein